MSNFGKFGPLIGIINIGNSYCKFLVYSSRNAEVLTFHEIKLKQFVYNAGWLEYDPADIWSCTQQCIEIAFKNMQILEINSEDIIALGICNQRGTTVLWDRKNGNHLHNAISWFDIRTGIILKEYLAGVKGNVDYVKTVCGLPLSTCFSSLKIKWLMENIPTVREAVQDQTCLFGTLDSWIIWNLTGGSECGIHATDVTNAGFTMLMNIHTLQWDKRLCDFFKIPSEILPQIRSNSEIYGYVNDGPFSKVPIASCIGEQSAALLGQLCINRGQSVCNIDESCYVLMNTGQEIIDSKAGLLSTVAFKLGEDELPIYALEGAISNAGSSVNWLKEHLQINTEINQNGNAVEALSNFFGENSMMSSSCSSAILNIEEYGLASRRSEITFVPAFNGLYSPYWRYDARGLILGLTSQTTAENVTQAAYEATGFQIHEILESIRFDTPTWDESYVKQKLIVGGDWSEDNNFIQYIADIVGCLMERPQITSPSCLGAMIAAGTAMKVISLKNAELIYTPPADVFLPTTTSNRRELLYKRWQYAVRKCLNWNNYETFEPDMELFAQRERDPNLPIRRSIPGSIFLTTSFILLLVAKFFHDQRLH